MPSVYISHQWRVNSCAKLQVDYCDIPQLTWCRTHGKRRTTTRRSFQPEENETILNEAKFNAIYIKMLCAKRIVLNVLLAQTIVQATLDLEVVGSNLLPNSLQWGYPKCKAEESNGLRRREHICAKIFTKILKLKKTCHGN